MDRKMLSVANSNFFPIHHADECLKASNTMTNLAVGHPILGISPASCCRNDCRGL